MKRTRSLIAILFFSTIINAQTFNFKQQVAWSQTPAIHAASKQFTASSAVGILDDRTVEYKVEGKEIYLYNTTHRIFRINDSKGIEMFNKIYVPVYKGGSILVLKARTILANGKVVDLPEDKIKETEEDGRKFKIFAMEGVEKGSEIEYIYTTKREPTFFGSEVFQNGSTPYESVQFTLSVPKHLKFDAKGFNGFKLSSDSLIGDQRIIVGYDENVHDIDDEKYAERDPYLKRVEYKLSYNLSNSEDTRIYTWKEFGKRIYGVYTAITSKEEKPVANLLETINVGSLKNEEAKIEAIENYIKSNINIDKNLIGEDAGALDKIIKRKSADNEGIIRLFANLFEKAGINYQIVFVGRRDEAPLDEDIENWNRVDETAFYFPGTKKYLSPTSIEYRYPYIPAYWAGGRGLFLKGTTIGSFKSAISSFGVVEMLPYQNHSHDMEVSVKFAKNMDTILLNSRQILTGYGAVGYRPIYAFLPKDKQDEATLEIIKSVAKSTDIKNIKVENAKLTDQSDNKPLIISADVKSADLVERAGDKILFKIGEIIGPQEQMYQEKPRQLPVEMPYPHTLKRKITFEIPVGYRVKNLNDLNISIVHKDGEETTMGFVSNYKQVAKVVTIDIYESYTKTHFPLSEFEEFKKIINASADFNKITLVLEKEK